MSDMTRKALLTKGISAAVAACLFAAVQGCATQPAQTQTSSDYASSDSASTDSASTAGSTDHKSTERPHEAKHRDHEVNPYFRTATSTSEGSVTVEGNTIHYHAVAGMLIVHPKGWNDAAGKDEDDPSTMRRSHGHDSKSKSPEASMFYVAYF